MRPALPCILGVLVPLLIGSSVAQAAPRDGDAYHIVLAKRALAAGESVELRLVPPPPEGVRVNYGMTIGSSGYGFADRIYRAPYVIPPGAPPVQVHAGFSATGFRVSATAEIELLPGSVPGATDCLGPGQSFSAGFGDIEPSYLYLDDLPTLSHSVQPDYPRSTFVRGVEDTIPVKVLVCRSGRVLDAVALVSYPNPITANPEPIERDPKLVEAALAAARQYIFRPGMIGGQPVAVWVVTAVAFRR
jgi:hypothetical protein